MNSNVVLSPLSIAYAAVTRLRTAAYRKGILKTRRLPVPVISVGNITVGGTGKTPLVAYICRILAAEKRRVCILTRGYGRPNVADRVVVSDGTTVLADVQQSGDEPLWLAENLKGVAAVICDRDRAAAADWAIENLGSDVFILDDGFQHLQLARDLDVLAIDATDPWGGRRLLPSGRLREPLRRVSRADCAIITRADQNPDTAALQHEIRELLGSKPILVSQMITRGARSLMVGAFQAIHTIAQPVAAFCAIGNPISFFNHLRAEGLDVATTHVFPDHHAYQQADILTVTQKAKQQGAASLITTAKDAVKLRGLEFTLPCYVLEIEIEIEQPDSLRDLIRTVVNQA
jgi:tetraacyldisaccharide 4'-kinase